jgi:hypothetical protein
VDPEFEKSITNIELFTSGTKYGFSSVLSDSIFNEKTDPKAVEIVENRIDCDDIGTCVLWTAKYRNISSISTSVFVEYLYHISEYSDEFMGYQPSGLKEMPVLVTGMLMALQKGSPFLGRVNEIIDRLIEIGVPDYLKKLSLEAKI